MARRPLLTVAICVLVFLACAWRVPVTFDEQETRADKLFTPQKSDSFTAEEYVYGTYGVPERVGEVYFVASGWDEDAESNDNVLTKEVLIGMLNWYERVMLATKADYEGETLMWTSDTICYRPGGVGTACDVASVLDLWSYDRAALEADGDVLATIQAGFAQGSAATDALGRPLSAKALIGGADTQVPGELTSAQALRLLFRAQNNEVKMESGPDKGEYMDPRVDLWERTLTAETKVWTAGEGVVDVRALTVGNEDEEAGGAITGDLQYLGIGCVVLLLYAAHVLGSNRAVESSAWLTLPSVLSIGMAITCSLGLGGLMGLTFNNAVQGTYASEPRLTSALVFACLCYRTYFSLLTRLNSLFLQSPFSSYWESASTTPLSSQSTCTGPTTRRRAMSSCRWKSASPRQSLRRGRPFW